MNIDKILVATDFSDHATDAVRCARSLALACDAAVLIVHVTETPFDYKGYGLNAETIMQIQEDLRTTIEEKLAAAEAECEGCKNTSLHIREGAASQQIVDMAKEHDIDMIVIATRGHSGLKHLLLGSTAERVVRTAPCPVLTVRK